MKQGAVGGGRVGGATVYTVGQLDILLSSLMPTSSLLSSLLCTLPSTPPVYAVLHTLPCRAMPYGTYGRAFPCRAVPCRAVLCALQLLRGSFPASAIKSYPDVFYVEYFAATEDVPGGDLFFFDYGVVACW